MEYSFAYLTIIFGLIGKWLYSRYQKYDDLGVEVCFVMSNDSNCCKSKKIKAHNRCQTKYCMGKLMEKIIKLIDSAKNSIDIAMYNFKNYQLINSIMEACSRGVDVKMIVDRSNLSDAEDNCVDLRNLKKAGELMCMCLIFRFYFIQNGHILLFSLLSGVDVRLVGNEKRLMHNKFCLIDSMSSNGIVISGSLNWSNGVCLIIVEIKFTT